MVLEFNELRNYLPQRFPMTMLDKILEYEKGKSLKGLKNVSGNDIFFLGHFPEMAIMPGALILEGLAQCMLVLFQLTHGPINNHELGLFGSVNARFLKPVFPGDQLHYEIEVVKMTSTAGVFSGIGRVNNDVVVRCEMSMGKCSITQLRSGNQSVTYG